jgi:hypothetical protein
MSYRHPPNLSQLLDLYMLTLGAYFSQLAMHETFLSMLNCLLYMAMRLIPHILGAPRIRTMSTPYALVVCRNAQPSYAGHPFQHA